MTHKRAIVSLIILLSVIFFPYWVYLPLIIAAITLIPFYWEGLALSMLADVLYGQGVFPLSFSSMSVIALTALIISAIFPLRSYLRLNI
jgi:hypothetical protein